MFTHAARHISNRKSAHFIRTFYLCMHECLIRSFCSCHFLPHYMFMVVVRRVNRVSCTATDTSPVIQLKMIIISMESNECVGQFVNGMHCFEFHSISIQVIQAYQVIRLLPDTAQAFVYTLAIYKQIN